MGSPPTTPTAGAPAPAEATADLRSFAQETQLVGARMVHFRTLDVQPPAALYVTADDGLYCLVSNIQASLTLNVTATVLLPDGRVQANSWNMTPPATGAQTAFLFPLAESFLLNVSVQPATGVRYGQTWVFVCIRRGGLVSGVNLQTLISDSVSSFGGPTWPGAVLHHSTGGSGLLLSQYTAANPLGQALQLTAPSYARVLVRGVFAQFVCSAAAASRQMALSYQDAGGNMFYQDVVEVTQAASSTGNYSWGLKLGYAQTAFQANYMVRGLPDIYLNPGGQMQLWPFNIQAGDQFKFCNVCWEQWFSF